MVVMNNQVTLDLTKITPISGKINLDPNITIGSFLTFDTPHPTWTIAREYDEQDSGGSNKISVCSWQEEFDANLERALLRFDTSGFSISSAVLHLTGTETGSPGVCQVIGGLDYGVSLNTPSHWGLILTAKGTEANQWGGLTKVSSAYSLDITEKFTADSTFDLALMAATDFSGVEPPSEGEETRIDFEYEGADIPYIEVELSVQASSASARVNANKCQIIEPSFY